MRKGCDAGSIFDPPDRPGLAHFVSRTIDRGTDTRDAEAIATALEDRGVSLAIDATIYLLGRLYGEAAAGKVAEVIEYDRAYAANRAALGIVRA